MLTLSCCRRPKLPSIRAQASLLVYHVYSTKYLTMGLLCMPAPSATNRPPSPRDIFSILHLHCVHSFRRPSHSPSSNKQNPHQTFIPSLLSERDNLDREGQASPAEEASRNETVASREVEEQKDQIGQVWFRLSTTKKGETNKSTYLKQPHTHTRTRARTPTNTYIYTHEPTHAEMELY